MKNLFIVNTPYHLSISTGLVLNKHINELNDLIIYKTFNLENIDIEKLKKIFRHIYIYDRDNPRFRNGLLKTKYNLKLMKKFIKHDLYNKLYIYNDLFIETQYIMDKMNKSCEIIYVEDGGIAYVDYVENTNNKKKYNVIKSYLKKILYGVNHQQLATLGTSSNIDKRMFLWPNLIRECLKDKEIEAIMKEYLIDGLEYIYDKEIDSSSDNKKMIVILENYEFFCKYGMKKLDMYKEILSEIIMNLIDNKIEVYVKYHPREVKKYIDDIINNNDNINIIKNDLPIELFFNKSNTYIISIWSTSLFTGAKIICNKNIISLARMLKLRDDHLINNFIKIGIQIPTNIQQINNILKINKEEI